MSGRLPIIFLVLFFLAPPLTAKNKKKPLVPDYVLKAQTVFVVIRPDAGEPLTDPTANRTAEQDVEKAIMKWRRFNLVPGAQTADLVIAVRKGHAPGPTIQNLPTDTPPLVIQSPGDGNTRVGAQQGRPPDLSNPGLGPANRGPRITNEMGPSEDIFEVYMGGVEYPLDAPPIWRYSAKDALKAPRVEAIEQFKKAIDESAQQRQHRP
jgi:hypothetical protein